MYSTDSRMQNAGLIQSQEFDTVFMGTSLAIHFRQSDIDRLSAVRSLKLAMTGLELPRAELCAGGGDERAPKAGDLADGRLDFSRCAGDRSDIYLPADLYRRNARGIASYLFSGAMARESRVDAGALDPAACSRLSRG